MNNFIKNLHIEDIYEKNGYKDLKLIDYNTKKLNQLNEKININSDKDNKLYKTKLCIFYKKFGKCNNGEKCKFAHGEDELRKTIKYNDYNKKENMYNFNNKDKNNDLYLNKNNIYGKHSMYDDISYSFDVNKYENIDENINKNDNNNINIKLTFNGIDVKDNELKHILKNPSLQKDDEDDENESVYNLVKKMEDNLNLYIDKIKQKSNNLELRFELNKIKKEIYLLKHNINDNLLI